jgi:uncharacterized protein DUF5694
MKQLLILISLLWCYQPTLHAGSNGNDSVIQTLSKLKNYDGLAQTKVMVVATSHFDKSILAEQNQDSIQDLLNKLIQFQPTKVVLEWEPSRTEKINKAYQAYLKSQFDIADKPNEVYQLGFKLAKQAGHQQLYLFDNQTEYIGSLKNFSFKTFTDYAKSHDAGFFDRFEKQLITNFEYNQQLISNLTVAEQISVMNSPQYQRINQQRMHMYELRVGIQKNWLGPDWLGRWYQRNIRMLGNLLKLAQPNERLLIFVGDNHKWVLDSLIDKTPDLELVSSWQQLKQ